MVEDQVKFLYSILRYEFIEKMKQRPLTESVQSRLTHLESLKEITINAGSIQKVNRVKPQNKDKSRMRMEPINFINFYNKMG